MKGNIEVEYWIDGHVLYIKNLQNQEIRKVKNQKQIAMFLNAHNLTVHDVKGVSRGYDVLKLFAKQSGSRIFSLLRR